MIALNLYTMDSFREELERNHRASAIPHNIVRVGVLELSKRGELGSIKKIQTILFSYMYSVGTLHYMVLYKHYLLEDEELEKVQPKAESFLVERIGEDSIKFKEGIFRDYQESFNQV